MVPCVPTDTLLGPTKGFQKGGEARWGSWPPQPLIGCAEYNNIAIVAPATTVLILFCLLLLFPSTLFEITSFSLSLGLSLGVCVAPPPAPCVPSYEF